MAVGRRDYTWGFLNEAASEGRYTESFIEYFGTGISAGATVQLYAYTVPAGHRLTINRIILSTNSRIINKVTIFRYPNVLIFMYFTENYDLIFSDQNPVYFAAGERVVITCNNLDEVSYNFYGNIIGSLQSLIL